MDTEFRRSVSKGAIFDAVNSAFSVANVSFAASIFRTFGMPAAGKVWTRFAKESGALFLLGFFGRNFSKSGLSNFLSSFFRSDISTSIFKKISMPVSQMFLLRKTFQVFNTIISFVAIYVVNVLGWIKSIQPASCDHTVHKSFSAQGQIAILALFWGKKGELSKNFSASRYSIKMVESSIFDSIYGKANHGEPFGVVTGIMF